MDQAIKALHLRRNADQSILEAILEAILRAILQAILGLLRRRV
jgi:hypothetical protein